MLPKPAFGLCRVRLGVLLVLFVTAPVHAAAPCDAGNVCLDAAETRSFEAARAALDAGRNADAITLLENMRARREQAELEPSLLIVNDLAVALARDGRSVEAALLLEDWLRDRPELDVSFSNLGLLYEALASRSPGADLTPGLAVASVTLRDEPDAAQPTPTAEAAPRIAAARIPPAAITPAPLAAAAATEPDVTAANAVRQQLESWRRAWERGDIESYLSFYSTAGSPRAGMARDAWSAQRRQRVRPDRRIVLEVSALEVRQPSADLIVTEFDQGYSALNYADQERKRLQWVQEAGTWRIRRELSVP